MTERLEQIKKRLEAATGGKWWWSVVGGELTLVATRISPFRTILSIDPSDASLEADRTLIVHSRADLSYLIEGFEKQAAEVERLKKALEVVVERVEFIAANWVGNIDCSDLPVELNVEELKAALAASQETK